MSRCSSRITRGAAAAGRGWSRRGRILGLQREDVDLDTGVLRVRETKFRKSRFVPLHPSAVAALRRYAAFRDRRAPRPSIPSFFLVDKDTTLSYSKLRTAFRRLRIRLGWENLPVRRPRVHDLRHTFSCRRLPRWHQEGVDVEARLFDSPPTKATPRSRTPIGT